MSTQPQHGAIAALVTILLSMVLMILPLPEVLRPFRLPWTTLVLIYWWLALPHRFGVTSGFVSGLILDALTGTLIGQHALALSVIAYITIETHQQLRLYPLLQQTLVVMVLLMIERLLQYLVLGITGTPPDGLSYWLPPLFGGILWPWVYIILRDVRRRFHVR
jgi:rod shape-determining protein MreD